MAPHDDPRGDAGEAVAGGPSELDVFLTGRWIFFTFFGPVLALAPISHEPWPLHPAVATITEDVTEAAGLVKPIDDSIAHFSPGVIARLGPPRPV